MKGGREEGKGEGEGRERGRRRRSRGEKGRQGKSVGYVQNSQRKNMMNDEQSHGLQSGL